MLAHVPNPQNKPQVNHIDSNPCNNHISNLEWCTVSENILHSYQNGRTVKGENHPQTKLTNKEVLLMREMKKNGFSVKQLAKIFNQKEKNMENIIYRYSWRHI